MTDRELRKLRRSDLLEMLIDLSEENERLRRELDAAQKELKSREIRLAECGDIAQAALQLSGIFQAAQDACDRYRESVEQQCQQRVQETMQQCQALRWAAGEDNG